MCFSSQRLIRSAVPTGGDIVFAMITIPFPVVWYGGRGALWPLGECD